MTPVRALVGLFVGLTCFSTGLAEAADTLLRPPVVTMRSISPTSTTFVAKRLDLESSVSLYLPQGWQDTITTSSTGEPRIRLTMHFHSAQWYAADEHWRRGARWPIVTAYYGEGSTIYRRPFEGTNHFGDMITSVGRELVRNGAPEGTTITAVELQSFSAGYGAIREILKSPTSPAFVDRVTLADSLYSSATTSSEGLKVPDPKQMASFIAYARRAAAGEVEFTVGHCSIVTTNYCSTVETADALVTATQDLGVRRYPASQLRADADDSTTYPLIYAAEKGGFHIWGYAGNDPRAHIAQARAMAEFWRTKDNWRRKTRGEAPESAIPASERKGAAKD